MWQKTIIIMFNSHRKIKNFTEWMTILNYYISHLLALHPKLFEHTHIVYTCNTFLKVCFSYAVLTVTNPVSCKFHLGLWQVTFVIPSHRVTGDLFTFRKGFWYRLSPRRRNGRVTFRMVSVCTYCRYLETGVYYMFFQILGTRCK